MSLSVSRLDLGGEPDSVKAAVVLANPPDWGDVEVTRVEPLRTVVMALARLWTPPRRDLPGSAGLRPSMRQIRLAQEMTHAAGEHAAGLVAHVMARVLPLDLGGPSPAVLAPGVALALYQTWCAMPELLGEAERLEEAEWVAWRLGASLRRARWADGLLASAQVAGGLALFDVWRTQLTRPSTRELADALVEGLAAHIYGPVGRAWDLHVAAERDKHLDDEAGLDRLDGRNVL